jgi:hypothetical protein
MKYMEGSPLSPPYSGGRGYNFRSGKSGGDLKRSKFIPHEIKNRYISY